MRYFIGLCMLLTSLPILAQDLALAAPGGEIVQPVSGCSLSSAENVTVRIFNFDANLPAGTAFNVNYTVNGGTPVTEMVVLGSTLLTNSSLTYTFTSQANLSGAGTYTINATVTLPGDFNPTNNTFTGHIVTNSANTVAGSVSVDQSFCGTTNNGSLSLSGHTGDIIRWETSEDGGITWRYVSQTTTQQNFLDLETTTQYRAVVKNNACAEAMSSFATVTIACPVPLTWVSFYARRKGNDVVLEWQSADEVNTSHFVIERNGSHIIGIVPATPPSGHYQFIDHNVPFTSLQYRIRQVDLDNRYSYSPTREVGELNAPPSLRIRNNPVKTGLLSFDVKGYPNGHAVISIFNVNGKLIRSTGVRINSIDQTVHVPMQGAAAGIYLLTIRSGNILRQEKFVLTQ